MFNLGLPCIDYYETASAQTLNRSMKHLLDRRIGQTFWRPPAKPGTYLYELERVTHEGLRTLAGDQLHPSQVCRYRDDRSPALSRRSEVGNLCVVSVTSWPGAVRHQFALTSRFRPGNRRSP